MTEHNAPAPRADGNGDRTVEQLLAPRSCSRFEPCNAAVCPLDADWRGRSHLNGEATCFWLRTAVKANVPARDGIDGRVLARARERVEAIGAHFPDIARRLARAARVPMKLPPRRTGGAERK